MMTLECMFRGFGAVLARGAVRFGRDAEGEVFLGWKEPAAARVRERLERRGEEEKRWKVLENRMVVVGWNGEWEEVAGAGGLESFIDQDLNWDLQKGVREEC